MAMGELGSRAADDWVPEGPVTRDYRLSAVGCRTPKTIRLRTCVKGRLEGADVGSQGARGKKAGAERTR